MKDKRNIYRIYNKIIDWFDAHRNKELAEEKPYLDLIQQHVPTGAVLDVGCGTGEPIAKFFLEHGYQVTGIDASEAMIELCKKRFSDAEWIVADMRALELNKQYNVVIAWHSFFHLPHEDQRNTLTQLASFVRPNGLLVFTSGSEYSEVWSKNGGHDLYHASLSADEYEKILKENGLRILTHQVEDPKCGGATIWVAKKEVI